MLRKLLGLMVVAGTVATLAPSPAHAAASVTVTFSAGAYVCFDDFVEATSSAGSDDICTDPLHNGNVGDSPAPFYAPVMPNNPACGTSTCPEPVDVRYGFRTSYPGLHAALKCNGVVGGGTPDTNCSIRSEGVVNEGNLGLGPYCGWSSGNGSFKATVSGTEYPGYTKWTQSAGTLLPLEVYSDAALTTLVGAGAVQTTGASPGTCGANGVTNRFIVTGFTTAVV